MSTSSFIMYLLALAVAYFWPGPDMALVVATSAARGAGVALVTALGVAASRALHVLLSGLGLAALMAAHPQSLLVVRWGGAAYLVYMAVSALRSAPPSTGTSEAAPSAGASLRRGFLTNLLNPKALLFCSLFLPQFITADGAPVGLQYLWLGAVLVLTGLLFDIAYVLLAARMARRLRGGGAGGAGKYFLPAVFFLLAGRLVAS